MILKKESDRRRSLAFDPEAVIRIRYVIGPQHRTCIAKSASLIPIFRVHSCDKLISSHRLGLGLEGGYSTKTPTHATRRMVCGAELFVQNNTFPKVHAKICRCIKSFNFIKYHNNDFTPHLPNLSHPTFQRWTQQRGGLYSTVGISHSPRSWNVLNALCSGITLVWSITHCGMSGVAAGLNGFSTAMRTPSSIRFILHRWSVKSYNWRHRCWLITS